MHSFLHSSSCESLLFLTPNLFLMLLIECQPGPDYSLTEHMLYAELIISNAKKRIPVCTNISWVYYCTVTVN